MIVDVSTCPFLKFQNGYVQRRTNCFVNSSVQALLSICSNEIHFNENNPVDNILQSMFKKEQGRSKDPIDLTALRKMVGFDDFQQHDVDEFIGNLLSHSGSDFRSLFQVQITSKAQCSACNFDKQTDTSVRSDTIIRLTVLNTVTEWKSIANLSNPTLRNCLNAQCAGVGATVTEFNQYSIPNSTKFLWLRIPLMDGVNRMSKRSIKGFSPSQVCLKFENFNSSLGTFKGVLKAVICHYGDNMDKGHYVVYRSFDNEWYLVDDQAICYRKTARLPQCMKDFSVLLIERI